MNSIKYICIIVLLLDGIYMSSQSRMRKSVEAPQSIFKFGVIAGPLLSQLDGDGYTGYNKLGLYGGLKGEAVISKDFTFEVNLAFSNLGSKIPPENQLNQLLTKSRIINITFAEVPLLVNYRLPHKKYPLKFELGLGLSHLISYNVNEDDVSALNKSFANLEEDLDKRTYTAIFGIERFQGNWTVGVRATVGISYFYYNETYFEMLSQSKSIEFLVPLLRSYYISLVGSYTIYGAKKH